MTFFLSINKSFSFNKFVLLIISFLIPVETKPSKVLLCSFDILVLYMNYLVHERMQCYVQTKHIKH